jgi:hypothetical protein
MKFDVNCKLCRLFLNNAFDELAGNFAFRNTDTVFIMPLRTLGVRASYNLN